MGHGMKGWNVRMYIYIRAICTGPWMGDLLLFAGGICSPGLCLSLFECTVPFVGAMSDVTLSANMLSA